MPIWGASWKRIGGTDLRAIGRRDRIWSARPVLYGRLVVRGARSERAIGRLRRSVGSIRLALDASADYTEVDAPHTSRAVPRASSVMPAMGTMRAPVGRVFSWTISAVRSAIQIRLATPRANITSISAQQQPTQKTPWRVPSVNAAALPRR